MSLQGELHRLVERLENDSSLFRPDQLGRRIEALDALDAFDFSSTGSSQFLTLRRQAEALSASMQALNETLYAAIRLKIHQGDGAAAMLPWIHCLPPSSDGDEAASGRGYDALDELIGGVLAFREPEHAPARLDQEMVFYQPTPARHILQLISLTSPNEEDVVVDLGSGLGHVPLLVAVSTGARCVGIEVEPSYVACARECGERLRLETASFLAQDARAADLSTGTVFYLHTPFTGSVMRSVLDRLRLEASVRCIRICTFGPCADVIAGEQWLESATAPKPDRITLFRSRA